MDVDTAKEWSMHARASLQWQETAAKDPRQNAQSGFCYTEDGICDADYSDGPPPKVHPCLLPPLTANDTP